jgi:hypothetical protein
MTLFHVLFDRRPEVACHVCLWHRSIADLLECQEDHGDGSCDHVQYDECECRAEVVCVACRDGAA